MAVLRTPESRFAALPDFPYEPEYVDVGDSQPVDADEVRMAYVDHGADGRDADETFLCLHGEPTWSFLYRKMLPRLADRGRVVAPDCIGFGRSDKYDDPDAYGFDQQYDALAAFVDALDLTDVTLVCQDWGGLLGLPYAARNPDRFARLVPMNTGLPDGSQEMPEIWHQFKDLMATAEDLQVGTVVANGCVTPLDDDVLAAYDAPFPDEAHLTGARHWPSHVPTDPEDPGADTMRDARERLGSWEKPAFVLFGDSDPITRASRADLRELIPTASDQPDVWVEDAGHFLQEDAGERIADRIVDFVDRT
jgi:haloalkane dehalogenase